MVESLLTAELRNFLADVLKGFCFDSKCGETCAPQIINGYLPPKRSGTNDDFPFVVVRADGGKTSRESTEVEISIIIGCYSKDFDGHEYCMNVMSRIKNALTMLENGTLANKYLLKMPITWSLIPEQPYPQWQLDMTTRWLTNTPQAIFDNKGNW